MIRTILIISCLGFISVQGQVLRWGKCPKFTVAEDFNVAEFFSGRFYEQKRYFANFESGLKCVNADYTFLPDNTVKVNNSGVNSTGIRRNAIGEAYCLADSPSRCKVRFSRYADINFGSSWNKATTYLKERCKTEITFQPYGDYNVLAADPMKYGLIFSCREVDSGMYNYQFAWILTRDKQISQADLNRYLNVFTINGIETRCFQDVKQDCSDN